MPQSAVYDQVETSLLQSAPFHNGQPQLIAVHRVVNPALERMYEQRRNFLSQKHGFTVEKELWHGTNCKAIPELLTHGLQPPSDTCPSDNCPKSGGKGLCTTLCGTDCHHCKRPHNWEKCQDPSEQLETVAEEWSIARGHDTFFVRGLNGAQRAGLGVYNSEFIVFQPFQVLPLYRVDYTLR